MTRTVLKGLNGSNPLGFMASVGLLRILDRETTMARLGFMDDGTFQPWIDCDSNLDVPGLIAGDAEAAAGPQPWRLQYTKVEKKRSIPVADLKAPPAVFSRFLAAAISEWRNGRTEQAEYAAAYATDVALDRSKENTKPTAFHFTAANQQFLGTVEESRRIVTKEWVERALHLPGQTVRGSNLRWDPDAERSRALMGVNPTDNGTVVNAPLEWLAFRALPAFPCIPIGNRIVTCGVTGRRQDEFQFHWPLWSCAADYATVRSLLVLAADWSETNDDLRAIESRRARGVFAVCTSEIRRTAQGYGNFGPALVRA